MHHCLLVAVAQFCISSAAPAALMKCRLKSLIIASQSALLTLNRSNIGLIYSGIAPRLPSLIHRPVHSINYATTPSGSHIVNLLDINPQLRIFLSVWSTDWYLKNLTNGYEFYGALCPFPP